MLRLATVKDADATWRFRRAESVSRWLTRAPQALAVVIAPDSASYGVVAERVRSVPQNALRRVTAEVSSNAGATAAGTTSGRSGRVCGHVQSPA
jgi:hypothetical protein